MNKAILIMDMPDGCDECPFASHDDVKDAYCRIGNKVYSEFISKRIPFDDFIRKNRPNWCPLREVPKKKPGSGLPQYDTDIHYEIGYNACIDEILGN